MTSRGALATAVIQTAVVGVAFALAHVPRWRQRHAVDDPDRAAQVRTPPTVIDLTGVEQAPARHC